MLDFQTLAGERGFLLLVLVLARLVLLARGEHNWTNWVVAHEERHEIRVKSNYDETDT